MIDAERIPVVVGVGQVNDRPDDPEQGLSSSGLMGAALRVADADAGGGWLGMLDRLAVVDQISWPGLDPLPERVAAELHITPGSLTKTAGPMGDSPVRLLNEAADRIGRGETRVEAVTGGEALRTAAALARKHSDATPMQRRAEGRPRGYAQGYGLVQPVDVYPLYENALRAALGQSLAEGQAESAALWAGMSRVAVRNPHAWLRREESSEAIATPGANNRPIAFPYLKKMVANASVNQGAAFIVTSLAEARRRGVGEDRLVYVGGGAAAREPDDIMARRSYARSESLVVSIAETLASNALTPADLAAVELYSCFPCVVKLARRVLDWPLTRDVTVFGGLTFGGGPIGNYMSHAIASMVERLRAEPGHGLLFGNGGFATYNHSLIVSRDPGIAAQRREGFDRQSEAAARGGAAPALRPDHRGPATIETYTVFYDRQGEVRNGVVVARTPGGERLLAEVRGDDEATLALLTDGECEQVGREGEVREADGRAIWASGAG